MYIEVRVTSKCLNDRTSSIEVLLRTSVDSDEVRSEDIRVMIIYLLLFG